jgi:7-carboxy-7-deazaguanine synthase
MSIRLLIQKIYSSFDSEVNAYGQGYPTTIIKMAGCNMDCPHCDIDYGPLKSSQMSIQEIIEFIKTKKVTITGGEPLLQTENLSVLLDRLINKNIHITIKTNGSLPLLAVDSELASYVVDFKLHDPESFLFENVKNLSTYDWIKFVIDSNEQYRQALVYIRAIKQINSCVKIALSPIHKIKAGKHIITPTPEELLSWMILDEITDNTVNFQLHKFIR